MTEIGPIAVHPDWQGKGVGRQLMTTIESRAKGGKCTVGIVSCRSDIIPFFEHMGYEVSSLWPNNDLRSYLIRFNSASDRNDHFFDTYQQLIIF